MKKQEHRLKKKAEFVSLMLFLQQRGVAQELKIGYFFVEDLVLVVHQASRFMSYNLFRRKVTLANIKFLFINPFSQISIHSSIPSYESIYFSNLFQIHPRQTVLYKFLIPQP